MIHPTAIIHPKAKLDATVHVGPYAVVDAGVELGANCVVGDSPQDLKYKGEPTRLRIGNGNVFREHVTIHRSNKPGTETLIGAHNFLMANSHVAHNCIVGDHVILANGALLGGHAVVQDGAFISGNCLVHQFTRVGTLALMQGGAAISQDLPPFTIALRENEICGLNVVGLRRAGFTTEQRLELKRLYHQLFRSGKNLREALAAARQNFSSAPAKSLLDFIAEAKRGVCPDSGHATGPSDDE